MSTLEEIGNKNKEIEEFISRYDLLSKFPTIRINDELLRDIWINFDILLKDLRESDDLFYYELEGDETIERVVYQFYEEVEYGYVVILLNKIFNPFFELPLKYAELEEVTEKTVEKLKDYIRTYYADKGIEKIQLLNLITYSNVFDVMEELNSRKRGIFLIKEERISDFEYKILNTIAEVT